MSDTQKRNSFRSAFGCAFGGCGTICLIFAVLLGLVGLMKFAQSQRPTSSVEVTVGDSTQTLHEPIKASLATLTFPLSNNQSVLVDSNDPNKASIHSSPGNGLRIGDSAANSVIIIDNIRLERNSPKDKWHLSNDEVESIASQVAPKEAINQNSSRSKTAFTGAVIFFVVSIVIFLIAKSFRN